MQAVIVLGIALLIGILSHFPATNHSFSLSATKNNTAVAGTFPTVPYQPPTPTTTPTPTSYPTPFPTLFIPTNTPIPAATPTLIPKSPTQENVVVHPPSVAVPEEANAKCSDGTYSFSHHHKGTCSRHGGVAEWL